MIAVKAADGRSQRHRIQKIGIETVDIGPVDFEATLSSSGALDAASSAERADPSGGTLAPRWRGLIGRPSEPVRIMCRPRPAAAFRPETA